MGLDIHEAAVPRIDKITCTGCGRCAEVCSTRTLAMLFHHDPQTDPADAHIAATYAMLAAQSLGLGSCMLGTCSALGYARPFKAKYGIPPGNKIGLGLVLGYPAATFLRGVRRKMTSVAFA